MHASSRLRPVVSAVVVSLLALGACGAADGTLPAGARVRTIAGLSTTEAGTGDRWVVMLHGASTSRSSFYPLFPELLAERLHVLAVDYDGSSDATSRVEQIVGAVQRLGARTITLVGSSLGAGYALRAAEQCCAAVVTFSAVEVVAVARPVFSIASRHDGGTASIARRIVDGSGKGSSLIVGGSVHGVDLIDDRPALRREVARWIRGIDR